MLNTPAWIRILIRINRGVNHKNFYRNSKYLIEELKSSKLITQVEDHYNLTNEGRKIAEGMSFGLLEGI